MKEERIVLGGGCFWCIEAVYANTKGVLKAESGYTGGLRSNPSYEQVCTGVSGHAEIVDIRYDAEIISLEELVEILFSIHNPTTLNQQGADRGTQYRSVLYYESKEMLDRINACIYTIQKSFDAPIVTEVSELETVYKAEAYHQEYFKRNPAQGYCQAVIAPKLQKFMTHFPDKLG